MLFQRVLRVARYFIKSKVSISDIVFSVGNYEWYASEMLL